MHIRNRKHRRGANPASWLARLLAVSFCVLSLFMHAPAQAGAFIFAGESYGIDLILHPSNYTGTGGTVEVGVCISPSSANASQLEIPVQNNIFVWNALAPVASNVQTGVVSGLDVESVLLHEMGHCIGLAHVNAATESGLSGDDQDYTKATDGANNVFDIDDGIDNVIGSYDDQRGDDVNLHWFNPSNDPFLLPVPTPTDTSTYRRDLSFLPAGHSFAENASRFVASLRGYPSSEAVMQQLTYYNETQRDLTGDGVATIRLAASGIDETSGTSDDYQLELVYRGITTSGCDITISMEGTSFAYCSVGGSGITSNHWRITSGSIFISPSYNWVYNTELRGNQLPVAVDDTGNVDEDSSTNIDVLANDSDPDEDALSVSVVGDPPNGTASINPDDTIAYVPDPNFNGSDNFTYTIEDTVGATDSATITVTVNPLNDLPVAVDDSAATTQDDSIDIYVLANDTELDGETLTVTSTTQGSIGAVTNHGSYVTYQPDPAVTGQDTFDYTVSDGQPGSTDSATVTVDIAPKIPPVASFTFSVSGLTVDFTDTSSDPDGSIDAWSWDFGDGNTSTAQNPSHVYASDGQYTVILTVTDNHGLTDQASQPLSMISAPDALTATPVTVDSVELTWSDKSTIETGFEIDRSPGGAGAWTNIGIIGADVTTFNDNADLTDGSDYDYRVRATGPGGHSDYTAIASVTTFECATSKTYNGGEWYQFALACDPGPYHTVAHVFDPPHPLVYRWDASAMTYIRLGPSDPLTPQSGYWVNFYNTTNYTQSGYNNSNADIPLVTDSANGRSNLVGFHGTGSVSWPDTLVVDGQQVKTLLEADPLDKQSPDRVCDLVPPTTKCLMSRILRVWGGTKASGSYQVYDPDVPGQEGTVVPLDGLWVKAFKSGVQLRLPDPVAPASEAMAAAAKSAAEGADAKDNRGKSNKGGKKDHKDSGATWYVRLVAEQDSLRDPGNTLGQKPGSIDGRDSRDLEEPAPFGGTYLTILFTNPLLDGVDWGVTTDFRAPTDLPVGEWPFVVKTSSTSAPITLRWVSDDYDFNGGWLLDQQTGMKIAITAGDSYTFQPVQRENNFVFVIE